MPSDLISRKSLIDKLETAREYANSIIEISSLCGVLALVDVEPTVDAVPVVHGEWIPEDVDYGGRTEKFKCSACGRVHFYGHYVRCLEYEFCPMCGAKMDGGTEADE